MSADVPGVPVEILPYLKKNPELSIFGTTKTPKQQQSQPVTYRCGECHFETSNQQHYNNHMMEHKSQKDYPCPICNKIYKSENRLQIHMQTHATIEQHVCIYCEKRFKSSALLNNHIKTHFPEEVICGACNKHFSTKTALKRHVMSVHANENFSK